MWRERETLYHQQNVHETDHCGQCLIALAGIMYNGRTELHISDGGTITPQQYCTDILLKHVRLFRGAVDPDSLFIPDNAHVHQTTVVSNILTWEDIKRMTWPAYSPYFNLI